MRRNQLQFVAECSSVSSREFRSLSSNPAVSHDREEQLHIATAPSTMQEYLECDDRRMAIYNAACSNYIKEQLGQRP
jgi:hypothetical protein